jgi:hypothetical protein
MWPDLEGENRDDARRFAARIERAVAALADEASTDWYTARLRAHAGATPALAGPDAPSAWRRAWALGDRGPKRRRRSTAGSGSARRWPDLG